MTKQRITIIRASIINPINFSEFKYYPDGVLIFDNEGYIIYIGEYKDIPFEYREQQVNHYPKSFILPGFIDCHTHIPQYDAMGLASDELLSWLDKYIFPLESKFAEQNYYTKIIDKFFDEAKSYGTTTICAFSSSHLKATDYAFESAKNSGIRAYIGKTMMDIGNQKKIISNTKQNIEDTIELIEKWHNKSYGLLNYILSPRYAGSCSLELMKHTNDLALKYKLPIQTHIAENKTELEFIRQLFPRYDNYLHIYKEAGFLDSHTLFAHCIYLDDNEIEELSTSNCSIVHCPTSNIFLQSGFMQFFRLYSRNINICLGTDIAGGFSLSMLNETRSCIENSKILKIQGSQNQILSSANAIYLSTLGGAKALNIDNITGNFDFGKSADFIIISPDFEINDNPEQIISKIIYLCSSQKVDLTVVRGIKVWEKH